MSFWILRFFEEESGKPSLIRLYSVAALVMSIILSIRPEVNYELTLTWLVAAFAPKVIQKIAEKWNLPKAGK